MERRKFIRYIGTIGSAFFIMPSLIACKNEKQKIKTKIIGANKKRGHLVRDIKKIPLPSKKISIDTIIVGGGMSGLSCGYHLQKNQFDNFLLFELNEKVGGNSSSSENETSKFPLGAHYLTLPNPSNRDLINFLKEIKLITSETLDGKQVYSEEHLCHAPDERLLFRGIFQEGLVPSYGISANVKNEIDRFFHLMEEFKLLKDENNTYIFDIPLTRASKTSELLFDLDKITFIEYLKNNNFNSDELLWFLDYCCRDDFGAGYDKVSAWAGINYFAGRKSNPANTIPSNVLTWPEGNGFLVSKLKEPFEKNIRTNTAIISIEELIDSVKVIVYNIKNHEIIEYNCNQLVLATPTYLNKHILKSSYWSSDFFDDYVHHPWLVTTVTLSNFPDTNGLELAWDNVKFGTKGLGYIFNQHQEFNQIKDKYVISVYLAFDKQGDINERKKMFELSEEDMKYLVLEELKNIHPSIEQYILAMDFQQWGHGMVTPYPGSLRKSIEMNNKNKFSSRIKLAHTDYSGYSIFEEAFSMGKEASDFVLNKK
jgi:protoporphyrinogen oxidase